MLRKYPKGKGPDATFFGRIGPMVKGILVLEVAFLGGTFLCWHNMNKSRDFRYKMYQYCPPVLNMYYKIGEKIGDYPTKSLDYKAWNIKSH